MSTVDAIAGDLRRAANDAIVAGATVLGTAATAALVQTANAALGGQADSRSSAFADSFVKAFGADVAGRIATSVDDAGVRLDDATIHTRLAAFASGQAVSPIDDVTVEHTFTFALGTVATVGAEATVTLTAQCAFDPKDASPKTTTNAKVDVTLSWSSAAAPGAGA